MGLAEAKLEGAEALIARYGAGAEGGWAGEARGQAAARLREMGAPTGRDEYWKYTDPRPLLGDAPAAGAASGQAVFGDVDALSLVFVDGVFSAEKSDAPEMAGLEISSLASSESDIHWAKDLYGQLEAAGQSPVPRPLAALNTAAAREGVLIRATGAAARPVAIRYEQTGAASDQIVHHVVKLAEGASLTLLESGAAPARFNQCLEVEIADGAAFHHIRCQGPEAERLTATHLFARLGTESELRSFTLAVSGALTRNEAVITLTGDDAAATVGGAAAGNGAVHHDDTVFVTHDAVNCESRQVFKKVLRNGAIGAFQGKILVQPDAQKTDGYQISQGLLLDEDSQFLAKPELEIYADDVACSHGSTVGSVDEEALFYLTSRGVPRSEAEDMLVLAFLDEAIQEIESDDLADAIRGLLARWMAA